MCVCVCVCVLCMVRLCFHHVAVHFQSTSTFIYNMYKFLFTFLLFTSIIVCSIVDTFIQTRNDKMYRFFITIEAISSEHATKKTRKKKKQHFQFFLFLLLVNFFLIRCVQTILSLFLCYHWTCSIILYSRLISHALSHNGHNEYTSHFWFTCLNWQMWNIYKHIISGNSTK